LLHPFVVIVAVLLTPASLLAQERAPVLGKAPFNGLKARVTAIRFFESGGAVPAAKDRVITTKFDALTTRFINLELELSYPKAAKPTAFQVECRYEGPDGKTRVLTLAGKVEPGWTGSYHTGGAGSGERGQWAAGLYKVNCREEGELVAATQLEVVQTAAAVRALGAAVVQLKFFQSLAEQLPLETRRYSTRFEARTARWIKTEFALVYPPVTTPVRFVVECAYVFPDNSVKRVRVERQIPAGWTGSVHAQGVELERWPVGEYAVSCWNNGVRMKEGRFEVFEGSGVRGQGAGGSGGTLRFATREGPYATAFEAGSYDTLYVEASMPARAAGDSTSFGCLVTDPAGITSAFTMKGGGEVREKEKALVASGPVGILDPPKLRGAYRVECRTGARAVVTDRFEVRGKAEVAELDARLVSAGLYAGGEEPPDDEAVGDLVFSAAKLKSLWPVALLDHPSDAGVGTVGYSCRVSGARNVTIASSGPQTIAIERGERAIVLRQRLAPAARQRWVAGKYTLSCTVGAGAATMLSLSFDLTR
jgi:hypothetical protein